MAGWPASDSAAPPASTKTAAPAIARPAIQPARNAGPLWRARGVPKITTTPMIGIGLSAIPTAKTSSDPIAWPTWGELKRFPSCG